MEPQLMIAPEGRGQTFWRNLYSNLRQWQDNNQPNAAHKLQRFDDGDGLYINPEVESAWDDLTRTNNPRWTISVVPATLKAPVLNVDHKGEDGRGNRPAELLNILAELPNTFTNSGNSGVTDLQHPSIERHLTLQALRFKEGLQPLDDAVDGIFYWTWLDGTFGNNAAPAGYWFPVDGQVFVNRDRVDSRNDGLGVRPEVRG